MKRSLAALAALGAIVGSLPASVTVGGLGLAMAQAGTSTLKSQPGDIQRNVPGDTKVHRLGTGYTRRRRAYVGKRYSASVRQHQRHAAKARRRRRAA